VHLKKADKQFLDKFKHVLNNYLFHELSLEQIDAFAEAL